MKHSTITDIAKKLGVSPSTVSRALSDHPDISPETKRLVKDLANELNFRPNAIAQSLKNKRTTTIGVIVPEIKHDFFAYAISGIEEVAYNAGYTIIVCQSNESYEREVVNTNLLMHQRVAGIIVSISQNTKQGDHFRDWIERGIPLVFFDRVCNDVHANKVIIDDHQSAANAVHYLIEKGYRKIAHFAGPQTLEICQHRLEGYKDALKYSGIEINEDFIKYGGMHESDGYKSMDDLLGKNLIPDAIFAVTDPVAVGAFQRINEACLRIPKDIALIGYSNNEITTLLNPPLTTINQPSFEMGKKATEILINMIERKNVSREPETVVLKSELIIRAST
ncbi:MAG: LacI family DNA-binding transcriptional regulator [bacterium]